MFLSMGQGEVMLLKESKLVDCKFKNPGDVDGSDGMGEVIMLRDERHVVIFI